VPVNRRGERLLTGKKIINRGCSKTSLFGTASVYMRWLWALHTEKLYQPFTAPAVMPAMIYLLKKINSSGGGMVIRTTLAKSRFQELA
jgi:hypothetical protein